MSLDRTRSQRIKKQIWPRGHSISSTQRSVFSGDLTKIGLSPATAELPSFAALS